MLNHCLEWDKWVLNERTYPTPRSRAVVAYTDVHLVTPEYTRGVIDPLYHSIHNGRDRQYECDRGICSFNTHLSHSRQWCNIHVFAWLVYREATSGWIISCTAYHHMAIHRPEHATDHDHVQAKDRPGSALMESITSSHQSTWKRCVSMTAPLGSAAVAAVQSTVAI